MELIYSPLETVFESTLQREGKTVTAYTSGTEFTAFMRRNDDGNNFEDKIFVYYPITAPVVQGSLIAYGNKIYILINRETEENTCYYKSSAIACNGIITLNNGNVTGVPCYAYDMGSALVKSLSTMTVIDGNMEFITESSVLSRNIAIGDTFNQFGRTYKVDNTYFKDGILHLVCEVYADETPTENNEITLSEFPQLTYTIGDTAKIEAALTTNGTTTTGTVTWTSTDNTVATIDGEGNISFIGEGSVAFKGYWVEKNIDSLSSAITVGAVTPTPSNYRATLEYNGSSVIKTGGSAKILTAHLYDGNNSEIADTTWTFTTDFIYPSDVIAKQTGNQLSVKIADDDDAIGETLTITAMENYHGQSAIVELEVDGLF